MVLQAKTNINDPWMASPPSSRSAHAVAVVFIGERE